MKKIHWIRHTIPTPYLVGPVHLYELEIKGKRILVDTGPQTPTAEDYLRENLRLETLDFLLITHFHPDHYGLMNFIAENSPAQIFCATVDALLYERFEERIAYLTQELGSFGFPKEMFHAFERLLPDFQGDIPMAKRFWLVEEHQRELGELGIHFLACPGHSQSDLVYLVGELAITGDTLLENIFTAPLLDMDLTRGQGRFSNYLAYVESIPKLLSLQGRQILPSHNAGIVSVEDQLAFYLKKMLSRSRKIRDLQEQGKSRFEMLQAITPPNGSPFHHYIKAGELFFLLDFLSDQKPLQEVVRKNTKLTDIINQLK